MSKYFRRRMKRRCLTLPVAVLLAGLTWWGTGNLSAAERRDLPGSAAAPVQSQPQSRIQSQMRAEEEDWGDEDWDEEWDDALEEDFADEEDIIPDPLEPLNRLVFAFNDKLYFSFLKPLARGWRVLPVPVRSAVSRFYVHLQTPVRFVSCGLQFKFRAAGIEALRFAINSTIGVLGLFDPARAIWGLRKQDEDLGQVLGRYGFGHGFYLVLPFWGPSSFRDSVGLTVETLYLDPVYVFIDDFPVRLAVRGVDMVNYLSLDKDSYEAIKRDALDPYSFMKNAYAQNRAARVRQ